MVPFHFLKEKRRANESLPKILVVIVAACESQEVINKTVTPQSIIGNTKQNKKTCWITCNTAKLQTRYAPVVKPLSALKQADISFKQSWKILRSVGWNNRNVRLGRFPVGWTIPL
jgi:hypothetical protein